MFSTIRNWLQRRYRSIIGSIAFLPACIAIAFGAVAVFMIWFELSGPGIDLKGKLHWLSLKDANAARAIISTIASGIITLTVFSFSMVMIVLNQAASQLSNRILDQLIGNRFQQLVLGVYIGTIVYALFLLTTIREGDTGNSVPALSTYLLIVITIFDIFLFIYFLHYVTRSVKYEVIINTIHKETLAAMVEVCTVTQVSEEGRVEQFPFDVLSERSGILQHGIQVALLELCRKNDLCISFSELPGSYILKGAVLMHSDRPIDAELNERLNSSVSLASTGSVDDNYAFGFRQLTEVAMKALSPGVNDPGTALLALRALSDLFAFRILHFSNSVLKDRDGKERVHLRQWTFDQLFNATIMAIWDYGKEDRSVRHELEHLIDQLQTNSSAVSDMLIRVRHKINETSDPISVH